MKHPVRTAWVAICLLTAASAVAAVDRDPPPPSAADPAVSEWHTAHDGRDEAGSMPHGHPQGGHETRGGSEAMAILHHLNLSTPQHEQLRAIHAQARVQQNTLHELVHADHLKLLTTPPTDPTYRLAVSAAKEHAAAMIEARASVWTAVYTVLTPAQRAQIPALARQFGRQHEHRAEQDKPHRGWHDRQPPAQAGPAPAQGPY